MIVVVAAVVIAAFAAPSDAIVSALVEAPAGDDVGARLEAVTRPFLDAPYVLSPLGEGPGAVVDADPRLRFDAFDCTTFVETALALALSSSMSQAQSTLDEIRYRGAQARFENRRHFPEAEWIPELRAAGLIEDITRAVGGDDVVVETKQLSPTAPSLSTSGPSRPPPPTPSAFLQAPSCIWCALTSAMFRCASATRLWFSTSVAKKSCATPPIACTTAWSTSPSTASLPV